MNKDHLAAGSSFLQVVVCKVRPGVTDEQVVRSADAIMPILKLSPGWIHREFRKTDDGRWVDCLWWSSVEAGEQIAMAVHTSPEGQAMSELLEETFELYNCFPVKAW